ncbi:MAG TPA: 4Fe-4S dicluster domain-containing protein [bacterium]|nr:4Fe-4S dicluster domain-containing protein [bacterium]
MEREIITIDEEKCNGCGLCVPGCPEGALQIIDGKARLISDLFCDGLGACIGHCPEGAISIEKRESEPYDERRVMQNIIQAGPNTIRAHLAHLREHGETAFLEQALDVLKEKGIDVPEGYGDRKKSAQDDPGTGGCPGSRMLQFGGAEERKEAGDVSSQLRQWPVQLHLVSPGAPYYRHADVILAADCTAFALGDFHHRFLKGKALAIACPKLDEGREIYLAKLRLMIDEARINTLTVVIMQVPCCGGLLALAREAAEQSTRKIPLKKVVVGIRGEILSEEWA